MSQLTLKVLAAQIAQLSGKAGFDAHAANDRLDALEGESASLHEGVKLAQETASSALDKANEALVDAGEIRAEQAEESADLRSRVAELEMDVSSINALRKRVDEADAYAHALATETSQAKTLASLAATRGEVKDVGVRVDACFKEIEQEINATSLFAKLWLLSCLAGALWLTALSGIVIYLFIHA